MGTDGRWRLAVAFAIAAVFIEVGLRGQDLKRVFIAQSEGRWCSYADAKSFESAPKDEDPEYIAIAEARGNRLTVVRVRRSTEDTTTYDDYAAGGNGMLQRLNRSLDDVSEKITRNQTWDLRPSGPVKLSESWFEFKTHKPMQPSDRLADLTEHAIITRVLDFPFHKLVENPYDWHKSNVCITGDAKTLEIPFKH